LEGASSGGTKERGGEKPETGERRPEIEDKESNHCTTEKPETGNLGPEIEGMESKN
jgi:hypothetical protein